MANTTRYRGLAFWLAAAALGAAFFHGPIAVWGRSVGATVAAGLALVALGVCFGYARPHRPWRWALAAVSLLPVIAAVQTIVLLRSESAGRLPPGSPAPGGFSLFVFWLVQIPIAIIPALPVLFGAYVGAFVKERLPPVTTRAARPTDRAIMGIGGALGLVASVPYVLSAHASARAAPLWLTPALIFLFAWLFTWWIGAYVPGRVRHCAVAVGSGLPWITIVQIVVDGVRDPTSHNLFPFEIIISLILAYPAAFAGAYAAKWTHRPSPRPSPGDPPASGS